MVNLSPSDNRKRAYVGKLKGLKVKRRSSGGNGTPRTVIVLGPRYITIYNLFKCAGKRFFSSRSKLYPNPLYRHFENSKKGPPVRNPLGYSLLQQNRSE